MSTPRAIVSLKTCPEPDCAAIMIGCDCGKTTHLLVDFGDGAPVDAEAAWTCDGCLSVRWFTVRVTEDDGSEEEYA